VPDDYDHIKSVCAARGSTPSSNCSQFLGANEKAAQEYELERRFAAFEDGVTQPLRVVPY
jgi:hypothetical protein